ncbi:hypothetical protein [[Mycoplasma] testudinis]|uniref:hypothetical protein n=1 Tax=[Mycoplasma] testudinis TaxID=33924 RepID=UPI00048566E8|nr:hypothetical protein [[Mycoplasma] testudinis]
MDQKNIKKGMGIGAKNFFKPKNLKQYIINFFRFKNKTLHQVWVGNFVIVTILAVILIIVTGVQSAAFLQAYDAFKNGTLQNSFNSMNSLKNSFDYFYGVIVTAYVFAVYFLVSNIFLIHVKYHLYKNSLRKAYREQQLK